ncbi:MAG: hypothetical protein ABF292_09325 [Desulfobacterales bacterium]
MGSGSSSGGSELSPTSWVLGSTGVHVVFGVAGGTVSSVAALGDWFSEAFALTASVPCRGLGPFSALRSWFSIPGPFSLAFGEALPAAFPLVAVFPVVAPADFLALAAAARVDALGG